MQAAGLKTSTARDFTACALAFAMVFACQPKVYPEADSEVMDTLGFDPEQGSIVEPAGDAGGAGWISGSGRYVV